MNIICSILLIVAAGVIGRLWPRKSQVVSVPVVPIVPAQEYGLFFPPDCDEIVFKDVSYFHSYHSGDYHSVTIKKRDSSKYKPFEVVFKKKYTGSVYISNEVKGVVK